MSDDGDMLCRILWRHPSKRFFGHLFLFLLGVLSCLLTLQVLQGTLSSDTSDPPLYYSFADRDSPCDLKHVKVKGQGLSDTYYLPGGGGGGSSYFEEVLSVDRQEISKVSSKELPQQFQAIRTSINRFERLGRRSAADRIRVFPEGTDSGLTLWVVTPTFYRPEQRPELTRLAQALLPVKHFVHWIVIDDISQGSEISVQELQRFLQRFPLVFTLLKSFPPKDSKVVGKPRGVGGRRAAIDWLRKNAKEGVVYFADDDNTYDSDIFRQMRVTLKVTMWPVGLVTSLGVSSPIVKNGQVVGFYDGWKGRRKFPVDMAGFAINLRLFLATPNANMPWVAGYEEDELLRSLGVSIRDIVPLANNCTEILVWHTKTTRNLWPTRPKNIKIDLEANTNLKRLLVELPHKELAGPASSTKSLQSEDFSFLKLLFGGN